MACVLSVMICFLFLLESLVDYDLWLWPFLYIVYIIFLGVHKNNPVLATPLGFDFLLQNPYSIYIIRSYQNARVYTVFDLSTAHTPISALSQAILQSSNYSQCTFFYFFKKGMCCGYPF